MLDYLVNINIYYKNKILNFKGSSLCAKGKNKDTITGKSEVVVCFNYNFKDMDLFGLDLQNFLANKRIFIVQKVDDTIKVIFSTSVKSSNFSSFSTYLNLNKTEGNDFFEVLNYNIFYQMKESINMTNVNLTKMNSLNITEFHQNKTYPKDNNFSKNEISYLNFSINYLNLYENYNRSIYTIISGQIKNETNKYIKSDNLTALRLNHTYIFNNIKNQILLTKTALQIFTLPIPLGFDYENDYNIIITNATKFYFLFVTNPESVQVIDSFFLNIVYSLIFPFLSVCFLNFIIWVILGSCYYLYFKSILAPLKSINENFKELVFIKEKNLDIYSNNNFKTKNPFEEEPNTGFFLSFESNVLC